MSVVRLVVSADDFGVADEVNQAVVRAHRDGVLTNASLMVTGEAAAEAVRLARELPRLGTGLHLVLAQGRPAGPPVRIGALVGRDGRFGDASVSSGFRYAWLSLTRRGAAAIREEIAAQLDAFVRTGLRLSHVDGHLNMHVHPMVLPILLDLAPRFGVRALRLPREPWGAVMRYDGRHLVRRSTEGAIFAALARFAAPRLRAAGIATPERVYGMHRTGEVDEAYLTALVASLPAGTHEVYCHPALGRTTARARHQQGYRPEDELAALVSPRVRAEIARRGVELVSYQALASG